MAFLIDSSVMIALERRGLAHGALTVVAPVERIGLASITASELLAGVYRANSPERRVRREVFA